MSTHFDRRLLQTMLATPPENLSPGDSTVAGYAHLNGIETEVDASKGMSLLANACERDHQRGCALRAYYLLLTNSSEAHQVAVQLAEKACERGNDWGCTTAASAYSAGRGADINVEKVREFALTSCEHAKEMACSEAARFALAADPELGVRLLTSSCDANNSSACYNIGFAYQRGVHIAKDDAGAAPYYDKACRLDHGHGCAAFIMLWQHGHAETDTPERYVKKATEACRAGALDACHMMISVFTHATPTGFEPDPARSLYYSEIGCELGDLDMCRWAGDQHRDGIGTRKSPERAHYFFDRICQSNAGIERDLGCQYAANLNLSGEAKSKTDKALDACNRGAATSCRIAAWGFATGDEVPIDLSRGISLFERACDERDAAACLDLGQFHEWAQFGVEANKPMARTYYLKACRLNHPFGCKELERFDSSQG
ncbi:MAG: SEL1-like repeat protein [Pseudomonadota bacterium]